MYKARKNEILKSARIASIFGEDMMDDAIVVILWEYIVEVIAGAERQEKKYLPNCLKRQLLICLEKMSVIIQMEVVCFQRRMINEQ